MSVYLPALQFAQRKRANPQIKESKTHEHHEKDISSYIVLDFWYKKAEMLNQRGDVFC